MSKNQVQQSVALGLLILFVGVWAAMRKNAPPAPSPSSAPIRAAPSVPAPAPAQPAESPDTRPLTTLDRNPFELPFPLLQRIRRREEEKEREEEEERRRATHATHSPEQPAVPLPDLKIQAVFWGTADPQAIINRKTVSVGDTVEGVKIVAISKEGVTVSFNGQEIHLTPESDRDERR